MDAKQVRDAALLQAGIGGAAMAASAYAGRALTVPANMRCGTTAAQVGAAAGGALGNGASLGGAAAAGGAVLVAKAAAVGTVAVAAAPLVLGAAAVGAVGYGLYKLFKS